MTVTEAAAAPAIIAMPAIEVPAPAPAKAARLASLDIFRGITIAAMLLVNNPGLGTAYSPLEHAEWNGWTPTDFIFPFFLFIVGVAIPFSQSKRASTGASTGELLGGIWIRALSLIMLGLLLQGTPFREVDPLPAAPPASSTAARSLSSTAPAPTPEFALLRILRVTTYIFLGCGFIALLYPWKSRLAWILPLMVAMIFVLLAVAIHLANRNALANGLPHSFSFGNGLFTPWKLRIPGVLQRIGICYGVAASIALLAGWRTVLGAAVILMALYSGLMLKAPYHDHAVGSLTHNDNLARRIDEDVFRSHNYGSYPDPEGLLSSLPAIASVLLGVLVGYWLRSNRSPAEKCAGLLAMGVIVAIFGKCLDLWLMPINKQIWTPSFTVFTAGMGMLGLGTVFWFADVRGRRRWALPFTIYGMNAIAAFVFSGILVRIAQIIKVTGPDGVEKMSAMQWFRTYVTDAVQRFSDAIVQLGPHAPVIATPNNLSLAYALSFVLIIFLLMALMYVCRVFIKV
jgi:predicted acyltransferase